MSGLILHMAQQHVHITAVCVLDWPVANPDLSPAECMAHYEEGNYSNHGPLSSFISSKNVQSIIRQTAHILCTLTTIS